MAAMDVVLDASAVLALLQAEPGSEGVAEHVPGAWISAANLAEVASKLADAGMPVEDAQRAVDLLRLRVVPLDEAQAWQVGALRLPTRRAGLSLGDRACLALAGALGVPAITADRSWIGLAAGVEVRSIG